MCAEPINFIEHPLQKGLNREGRNTRSLELKYFFALASDLHQVFPGSRPTSGSG